MVRHDVYFGRSRAIAGDLARSKRRVLKECCDI